MQSSHERPLPKGIVFDLDGTVVDSLGVSFEGFNAGFTRFGSKPLTPTEIMSHFGIGETEIFARIIGRQNAALAYQTARAYLNDNLHRVTLHDGIPELLDRLENAGIPLSIFTGRSRLTTDLILETLALKGRFVTVITHDDVTEAKPRPEGLLKASAAMGLSASEVWLIGDSTADVKAAQAAGAGSVAALWDSFSDHESLLSLQPTLSAAHPLEILTSRSSQAV